MNSLEENQTDQKPTWAKYKDSENGSYREARAHEAANYFLPTEEGVEFQVGGRLKAKLPLPHGVLEVGPGFGGVTQAYRQVFPDAYLVAIDADPRATEVAKQNNIVDDFTEGDVTHLSDGELKKRLGLSETNSEANAQKIDHISALRTSGPLVLFLLEALPRIGYKGVFLFSLFQETDEKYMSQISSLLNRLALQGNPTQFFAISEMRGRNEIGRVVTFN